MSVFPVSKYEASRHSSSFVLGPVVIQPERNASATSLISSSVISGGLNCIILFFIVNPFRLPIYAHIRAVNTFHLLSEAGRSFAKPSYVLLSQLFVTSTLTINAYMRLQFATTQSSALAGMYFQLSFRLLINGVILRDHCLVFGMPPAYEASFGLRQARFFLSADRSQDDYGRAPSFSASCQYATNDPLVAYCRKLSTPPNNAHIHITMQIILESTA